ncbi:MAG: SUMF1/EgtB/PvdO family nonheme iron enzyme [Ktedonobacterales bacterium]|nr:SUMF1/EgtB/PvdO family nonheme iron enzyme [Ktedonobacterales bacterium]
MLSGQPIRVLRGGSWNNNPQNSRAAYRNNNNRNNWNNNRGFRVVRGDGMMEKRLASKSVHALCNDRRGHPISSPVRLRPR